MNDAVEAYLGRIGHHGTTPPTAETLIALHRAHLFSVPFETLDIALGRRLSLDPSALYDKIVTRRRGGFCYELNGLFGWLLEELGFDVTRLAARVFHEKTEDWGPERDHMLLSVKLDEPWIADVGFGDSFVEPFPMSGSEHVEGARSFRLVPGGDDAIRLELRDEDRWRPQVLFTPTPQALADFADMCAYQQDDPASPFVGRSVCSLATADGRLSLANGTLVITRNGVKNHRPIASEAELRDVLLESFGVALNDDLTPLMAPPTNSG